MGDHKDDNDFGEFTECIPLTPEELKKAKQQRANLKRKITNPWTLVLGEKIPENLTLEVLDQWQEELTTLDLSIDDGMSEQYYKRLGTMRVAVETRQLASGMGALNLNSNNQQNQVVPQTVPATNAQPMPTQRPKGYDKRAYEVNPFSGVSLTYNKFEKDFERIYENGDYPDYAQFNAYFNLIGKEGRELMMALDSTAQGLAEAKKLVRQYYTDPNLVLEDVDRQMSELKDITPTTPIHAVRKTMASIEMALKAAKDADLGKSYINGAFYKAVASKLPFAIVRDYWRNNHVKDGQKLVAFAHEMIDEEIEVRGSRGDRTIFSDSIPKDSKPSKPKKPIPMNAVNTPTVNPSTPTGVRCLLCQSNAHKTIFCDVGTAASRKGIAKDNKLCFRCLRSNHMSRDCRSTHLCRYCNQPHSNVICTSTPVNPIPFGANGAQQGTLPVGNQQTARYPQRPIHANQTTTEGRAQINASVQIVNQGTSVPAGTYFKTVMVRIKNGRGQSQIIRILLDSGAGRTMCSSRLAKSLNLAVCNHRAVTFKTPFKRSKSTSNTTVTATLESVCGESHLNVVLSVVDGIEPMRMATIPTETLAQLEQLGYPVCDVQPHDSAMYPIELILGLKHYLLAFENAPPIRINAELFVQKSIFGWVMCGQVDDYQNEIPMSTILTEPECDQLYHDSNNIQTLEQRADPIATQYLEKFVNEKVHYESGQYTVELPWIKPVQLYDNYVVAKHRLDRLIHQLKRQNLYDDYDQLMQETISNFAEPVQMGSQGQQIYYMPHHPVIRPEKTTTKIRIVYDGSSHAPGKVSLNDSLFKGFVTWSLIDALTKFQMGASAVIADVEKAYLMIRIADHDRDALRFIWSDRSGQVQHYRFCVVPFGTSASPFLLFAVLYDLFKRHEGNFKDIVPIIKDRFYVDDLLLTFVDSNSTDLNHVRSRVTQLFQLANMNIRKWVTNETTTNAEWNGNTPCETVKVLGHLWNVATDQLQLAPNPNMSLIESDLNKRGLSRFISSLYDPAGKILPYVIMLRLELSKLWQDKDLEWDTVIPDTRAESIKQLMSEAKHLDTIQFPRNTITQSNPPPELHVYCDASKTALGAVAYVCNADGKRVQLMAKGKLAKKETIPSLELDALFMARDIAIYLCTQHTFSRVYILSDSLLNLQRLEKHPNKMDPTLAVRLSKLKQGLTATFRHVTTKSNCADVLSRGCPLSQLMNDVAWWQGRSLELETRFESQPTVFIFSVINCDCNAPPYDELISSYQQNIPTTSADESITSGELALQLIIKESQQNHYADEIVDLGITPTKSCPVLVRSQQTRKRVSNPRSELRSYDCFVDKDGLLRLRTRLVNHPTLTYDQKFPIILSGYCPITRRIVEHEHQRLMHCGINRVHQSLRDRFFIIGGKRLVKSVQSRCDFCIRQRAYVSNPNFGPLPEFRLADHVEPFNNTGLDLFGPLKLHTATKGKRYGIIFSCASTRAIHLELLIDMTAEEVFLAMRRFMARRGIPNLIYSDNGSQLVKIKKHLLNMLKEIQLIKPQFELRLVWQLQAVSSPWRAGFYERLNRSIKTALASQTFARKQLSDNELSTVLTEVEAQINSRPLFMHDGVIITPSMFFSGKSLLRLPPLGNNDARALSRNEPLIDEFIKSQRHVSALWRSWIDSYLKELRLFHQNPTLNGPVHQFKVGDPVIIKTGAAFDTWPVGTIERIYLSPDGVARSFDVKSVSRGQTEVKLRSIQTLIPLECAREASVNPETSM